MKSSFQAASLVCLFVILVGAPISAFGEPKAWDQKEVVALLDKLILESSKLHKAVSEHVENHAPIGGSQTPADIVMEDMGFIRARALALRAMVNSGLDRDATEPVYRRLVGGIENARRDAPAYKETMPLEPAVKKGRAVMQKISAYYEG